MKRNKIICGIFLLFILISSVESQFCGNNATQTGEQCDDNNLEDGDGCDDNCQLQCGNGIVDPQLEECDDGNRFPFDGCDQNCQNQCGNGFLQGNQQCDFGVSGTTCSSQCVFFCGNGDIDNGQICDDGNRVSGDGCSDQCTLQCGDGELSQVEQCDDGNTGSSDGCSSQCEVQDGFSCPTPNSPCIGAASCGNGQPDAGEQCDDGNNVNGDGCNSACLNQVCGNGRIDANQNCDDSNNGGGDGCSATCQVQNGYSCPAEGLACTLLAGCGNGALEAGEECDDGNTAVGDGCSDICKREVCGNNILQARQQCDDGNLINNDGCDEFCFFEPVCGNGVLQFGEECDDNNVVNGDGCSSTCELEEGSACEGSVCNDIQDFCGNNVYEVKLNQGCDDGNKVNGDGCSSTCQIQAGFVCDNFQGFSRCTQCGNGQQNAGEACDDANFNDGDGCSFFCTIQEDYECSVTFPSVCTFVPPPPPPIVCGNGIVEDGEQCDDGNFLNGDGCDDFCMIEISPDELTEQECILLPNMRWENNQCVCIPPYILQGTICICPAPLIILNNLCQEEPIPCGNAIHQPAEFQQCDDGNTVSGDGCDSTCFVETGFRCIEVNGGSFCSRVSVTPGDGGETGEPTQVPSPECGNSLLQSANSEACDDGNLFSGDGCSSTCTIEDGFECPNNAQGARSVCSPLKCGNGIFQPFQGEQCEDFNRNDGDGCSQTCQIEPGWFCNSLGCFVLCGNGNIDWDFQEVCDDGGRIPGDGCDANCQIQSGFECNFDIFGNTVCARVCGNGFVNSGQQCDDANDVFGDGCFNCRAQSGWQCEVNGGISTCTSETATYCGNGKYEPEGGEQCDDGNSLNTDGCDNGCNLSPDFDCENIPGEKTVCGLFLKGEDGEPVQVCQNPSFILPGRALSNPVRNALAVTPFNGIDNMAQLVAAIVSTENGFTTIDPIGESILQSSLVSAGLNNQWNGLYILISLCGGRSLF